ncbi:hypothetical protein [Polaribacter cellanae]|uniref:Uncharacterized protein n=1 Tax=Polaribacter cellanae TaxID=2818493 RepID=A0A975CNT7_9FLAO|nr:hypothetical protein [Polaribacter cellanae]QTE21102.1 hypothetical protein J3359_09590 [Polaribacter cellanae]
MTNLLRQPNKEKAIDFALWQNFKHRVDGKHFGVIQSVEGDFLIVSPDHPTFKGEVFETLPDHYAGMEYKHIRNISMDIDPLHHFSEIKGMISVMDGEILRFILKYKIPLEKLIRYELASRGYDENHQWVGFEKAETIWLK